MIQHQQFCHINNEATKGLLNSYRYNKVQSEENKLEMANKDLVKPENKELGYGSEYKRQIQNRHGNRDKYRHTTICSY